MNLLRKVPYVFFIIPSCLLGSCATVLNTNTKEINIYTTKPSKIVFGNDTIRSIDNKVFIVAERRKQPITFQVLDAYQSDDPVKTITLKPRNSLAFYANLPFTYGAGLIVDWNKDKRYSYRSRVFLNSDKTESRSYSFEQGKRNKALFLHLSMPYINAMYFKPKDYGQQFSGGFLGISGGLDYYHHEKQFISFVVSGAMDFVMPIPAPYDAYGPYQSMTTFYGSLSNNHLAGPFTFGYGVSYGKNTWGIYPGLDSDGDAIRKTHHAAGLIFTSYYRIGRHFNLGVIYRPTFVRFGVPDHLEYEHYLGLDLAWKIRLTN